MVPLATSNGSWQLPQKRDATATLLFAELIGRDPVIRIVERRESVRRRRPLLGDVGVAAGAIPDADGRAGIEAAPRDLARDRRVFRTVAAGDEGQRCVAAALEARQRSIGKRGRRRRQCADRRRDGSRGPFHGLRSRRGGRWPGSPSNGTGERTSLFNDTAPRGAVASPFAAVGGALPSGLPGGPPQRS